MTATGHLQPFLEELQSTYHYERFKSNQETVDRLSLTSKQLLWTYLMDPRHLQGEMRLLLGSSPGNWQMRHTGMDSVDDDCDSLHAPIIASSSSSSPSIPSARERLAPGGTIGKEGCLKLPLLPAAMPMDPAEEAREPVERFTRLFLGRSFCLKND